MWLPPRAFRPLNTDGSGKGDYNVEKKRSPVLDKGCFLYVMLPILCAVGSDVYYKKGFLVGAVVATVGITSGEWVFCMSDFFVYEPVFLDPLF